MDTRHALEAAGFTRHTMPAPAGTLAWFEGGSGAPALLLLHGAGDQAGNWSAVAPTLAATHRLVIPDLPGHGDSEPATGPLPMNAVVDGIAALIASRPPGERIVIVGNSFGAWVAMLMARQYPGRIELIVLVNGGGVISGAHPVNLVPATREQAREIMDLLTDPASPRVPDTMLDEMVRLAGTGPIARMGALGASMFPYVLDGKLADYPVPVDLLWGASDRVATLEYARGMAAMLPRVRLTTIERCGHVPFRECPERFLAALAGVLAQPAPGRTSQAR